QGDGRAGPPDDACAGVPRGRGRVGNGGRQRPGRRQREGAHFAAAEGALTARAARPTKSLQVRTPVRPIQPKRIAAPRGRGRRSVRWFRVVRGSRPGRDIPGRLRIRPGSVPGRGNTAGEAEMRRLLLGCALVTLLVSNSGCFINIYSSDPNR